MDAIMQGTTPALKVTIKRTDFLLSNVSRMEVYVANGKTLTVYTQADIMIDTDENTFTRVFTETETAAFTRKTNITVQGRFWFPDGNVVGIKKIVFAVDDMIGVGD